MNNHLNSIGHYSSNYDRNPLTVKMSVKVTSIKRAARVDNHRQAFAYWHYFPESGCSCKDFPPKPIFGPD